MSPAKNKEREHFLPSGVYWLGPERPLGETHFNLLYGGYRSDQYKGPTRLYIKEFVVEDAGGLFRLN